MKSTPTTSTDTFTQDPPPAEGASGASPVDVTGNNDTQSELRLTVSAIKILSR